MNILIIGGSGFIGSHVADQLTLNNHKVTIFDKKESKWIKKNQKFFKGDILDNTKLDQAIKNQDVVYNFAGISDLNEAATNGDGNFKSYISTLMFLGILKS